MECHISALSKSVMLMHTEIAFVEMFACRLEMSKAIYVNFSYYWRLGYDMIVLKTAIRDVAQAIQWPKCMMYAFVPINIIPWCGFHYDCFIANKVHVFGYKSHASISKQWPFKGLHNAMPCHFYNSCPQDNKLYIMQGYDFSQAFMSQFPRSSSFFLLYNYTITV